MQVHNYGVTALYYLNEYESHSVRPFLSVGIGGTVYRLTPEARAFADDPLRGNLGDMDNSSELAFHYGVGFKTRSFDWLGFRADVRDFVGRTPSFGLARHSSTPMPRCFRLAGLYTTPKPRLALSFISTANDKNSII